MPIIGHQKIVNFLDKSLEKNQLAQAYLFSGPEHLGKFSLALEFARKINGESDQKNISSDIIILSPEIEERDGKIKKKDIKIEQVRELEHNLGLSASVGKYKIAIIDEAEKLNKASQNALLKTLEEPPQKTIIILITSDANKIISTIKSRCVVKRFNLVGKEEMRKILKNDNVEVEFWSLNRPGLAVNLQENKEELEKRKKAKQDLEKMLQANLSERFFFCESLSKNVLEMTEELNFWLAILRENILGNNKFFRLNSQKALKIILGIEKSLKIIRETNSNSRLVMENLMLEF